MTTYRRPYPAGGLTTQQAADALGVSVDTVMHWFSEGRFTELERPSGRRPRFLVQAEVEAFAAMRGGGQLPRQWRGLDLSDVASDDPVRERFWSKVDKNGPVPVHRPDLGPCWVYTEHTAEAGYGQFCLRRGEFRLAHAVSYALTKDPVPPRMHVCHHCDNPPCCNPAHLFLGTSADNALDCVSKGRARRARGVQTAAARLDDEAVRAIRAVEPYYGRGRDLARRYGVSDSTIRAVLLRETWRHVA